MFKLIRNLLLVSPAVAALVFGAQLSASAQSVPGAEGSNTQLLDQINNYSQEGRTQSQNQVTNVNQLRDVSPTDWAYEALRSLVDRYGCISGFPNQTYRGNQALTRYEFAAGLNSCLNQIERLIASAEAVAAEDLETINRLQQEFEAELATLGGRVDELESRTAFLEDNQFSTTTKLEGEVVFGLSGEYNNTNFNQTVFQDRVRLNFVSSFTGRDALYTRLDASNAVFNTDQDGNRVDPVTGEPLGFATTEEIGGNERAVPLETGALTYQTSPNNNSVNLGWLAYYFPIGEKIDFYLPAAGALWQDFVPTLSPYLDSFTGATGSLSSFAESSPIYKIGLPSGGGAGFNWNPADLFTFSAGYFGGDSANPVESLDGGVFNEEYAALGQATFNLLDDKLQLAGTYVFGNMGATDNTIYDLNVGTFAARQPFGDGTKVSSNSYGGQLAWQITDGIALNAFGMYSNARQANLNADNTRGKAEIWSYGAGFSFPDLGKEGSLASIFVGVQPYVGNETLTDTRQKNPLHIEGMYKFQLNDYIGLTPGIIYINNPNGNDVDKDAVIGVIRTTFTF